MIVLDIIICILVLAMIVVILVYNGFDRQSFRIDSQWKYVKRQMDNWVNATESLCLPDHPEIGESVRGYRASKKTRDKAKWARKLFEDTFYVRYMETIEPQLQEYWDAKYDLEEELAEFTLIYSDMAEKYNQRLESKFRGSIAKLLHLKPYPKLDFTGKKLKKQWQGRKGK